MSDIFERQAVFIEYIQKFIDEFSKEKFKVKAEYSTNDNDKRVIVVQEQAGARQVMFGNIEPLYNYYYITIYGLSIKECKDISLLFGNLIGKQELYEHKEDNKLQRWNMIFIQNSNPQFYEYKDIRRVGYNLSLQCILNKVFEKEEEA